MYRGVVELIALARDLNCRLFNSLQVLPNQVQLMAKDALDINILDTDDDFLPKHALLHMYIWGGLTPSTVKQ